MHHKHIISFLKSIPDSDYFTATGTSISMLPIIHEGDKILVKKEHFADLATGDVIAFWQKKYKHIIVHRIVKTIQKNSSNYYITKGDNNPSADPFIVKADEILGKAISVTHDDVSYSLETFCSRLFKMSTIVTNHRFPWTYALFRLERYWIGVTWKLCVRSGILC